MHRLLARQLRKAGLDPGRPPADPGAWTALLASVERSYAQIDEARLLMEQSMETLSTEMRSLHDTLAASQAEQAALRRVATAVAQRRELEGLFDLVAREAALVLDCPAGRVVRAGPAGATTVAGSWVCEDLREAVRELVVSVPIRVDGAHWGELSVTCPESRGASDPRAVLGDFADLVAVAVANAADRSRLAALAATDSLTGLANHRAFQERLIAETGRARRHGTALSLILIDLDRFKAVNDSMGHQAGDEVLVALAGRMRALVREGETLARVGGEEFAWLLPDSDADGAFEAAERLRRSVSAVPLGPVERQTISIGLCDLEGALGDPAELFRLADGALYWAKRGGRDRSVRHRPGAMSELAAAAESQTAVAEVAELAALIEARDPSAGRHAAAVATLAGLLAGELGWAPTRAEQLRQAGLLHDLGEVGLADGGLADDRPLSAEEYEAVKGHAGLGALLAGGVLGAEQVAWVRHHHERWDGDGYPDGLREASIPDGARLLGLAEAWDAMTRGSQGRAPLAVDAALAECRAHAGSQFDPRAVTALERLARRGVWPAPAGDYVPGSRSPRSHSASPTPA